MSTFVPWNEGLAQSRIAEELSARRAFFATTEPAATALLPLLHALQHTFGFVAPEAVPLLANALNLSKAEVRGVISFYSDFRTEPPTKPVIKLCRAEACQAVVVSAWRSTWRRRGRRSKSSRFTAWATARWGPLRWSAMSSSADLMSARQTRCSRR